MTSKDFRYHNENPYKIEENDCVCRAISRALGLEYEIVANLLELSASYFECDTLCVCCYNYLLEKIFRLPVRFCDDWETVGEIANMYPNNKLLIRIDGHLTMSDCGVIYDLWDCTNKLVDCYWIIPN